MKVLHSNATPQSLAIWRVCVLGVFILWMAGYDWSLMARIPREQLQPTGLLRVLRPFFDILLNARVLFCLQMTAFVAAILGILNICARWAVLVVSCLNLLYYALIISAASATHAGVAPTYAGFILATALFLEHRDASKIGVRPNYAPATLQFTALALLLAYTMIGVHRIAFAGPETLRADYLLGWFIERGGSGEYQYSLQLQDHPWLLRSLELGFPLTTLVEALAVFSLASRWFKWIFVFTIVPFHFMTLYFMNIFFWQNLLLMPLLLFDFSLLFNPQLAGNPAPVIYYDGVCGLCNRWIQWILRSDPNRVFRFAALQGEISALRLGTLKEDPLSWMVFLEDEEGLHERSDAALRIVSRLGGFYRFAIFLLWIPKRIRDGVYRWVARNRYSWFGKQESCSLPDPADRALFLP